MVTDETRYRASDRALLTELGDGTGVLLDMDSKFYFTLNETAIFVWKQLSAPATLNRDELAVRVSGEFDVGVADAARDIDDVLEMLRREHLVTLSSAGS